jgi:phage-related protein
METKLEFLGTSRQDLRSWPREARQEAGYQLGKVQEGKEPNDWKPMPTVGAGVKEIRVHDEHGAFRVFYVTKVANVIYVLHCFQKKSDKTSQMDIKIGKNRYKLLELKK